MELSSSSSLAPIFYLALLSCFLLITCCFGSVKPVCHNEERLALLQFKQSFTFDSTCSGSDIIPPKLASWNNGVSNLNCCSWDGVACDADTGHVVSLDLRNDCIYGSLHSNSTLFQLFHLQILDLSHNNFNYSKIPSNIAQLSELRHLSLSSSLFSGQIPFAISKLHKLSYLDLSDNIDTISDKSLLELKNPDLKTLILNLTSLQVLNLEFVDISSTIPVFLAYFSSLTFLILGHCGLHGMFPEEIFRLQNLRTIYVNNNPNLYGYLPEFNSSNNVLQDLVLPNTAFYGQLPFSIGHLLSLTKLILGECNFSGLLPFSLGNLTMLEVLDLTDNKFKGPIPSLGNLTKLEFLQLSYNDFNDTTDLSWLLTHSKLGFLGLSGLNLGGNSLSFLESLTNLELLFLTDCQMSGQFPSSIHNMSSLIILDMNNNSMIGMLPQWLGNFSTSLKVLRLHGNMFQGSIPNTFAKKNNLGFIDLGYNRLQGRVPRSLSHCQMLEVIDFKSNKLNDVFPSWLGSLPNLRVLVLKSNHFHGTIGEPETNSEFSKLHIIDLSYNNFRGNLPFKYINNIWKAMKGFSSPSKYINAGFNAGGDDFEYDYKITLTTKSSQRDFPKILDVFSVVDLSCNRFSGQIPYLIGNLRALQSLNLSHNMLTGPIPSSMGNMTQLEGLDLSNNKLCENIPPQLSKLTFLVIFNVSYNNLSGPIPQGNQFDIMESSSYEGNPGLCGTSLSNKCGHSNVEPLPYSEEEQKSFFEFGWKVVLIGYGCGMVVGIVVGNYIIERKQVWFLNTFRMTPKRRHKKRVIR